MKIFIRSSACISPQKTLGNVGFLTSPIEYVETRLKPIEPDYASYIDPKVARRMSHVIKMGIVAASKCLLDAGVPMPGAIITGTAYGCIEDTSSFLTRLIEMDEQMLSPTAFIQSTHNTVAAQIALMLRCHNYNNTFVHKGISFESALLDAVMLLKENEADNILVGGIDEMTDTSFIVLNRLGLYKRKPVSNFSLLNSNTKGTIGGEGAAFFLFTDKPSADNMAEFKDVQTFFKPRDIHTIGQQITAFLARKGLQTGDLDLVITGKNGALKNDGVYNQLNNTIFKNTSLANYKHLCGEYPTSTSFALWLAVNIIKRGEVPEVVRERTLNNNQRKNILIYNHYLGSHSLMLISAS